MDVIDRVPPLAGRGGAVKKAMQEALAAHRRYVEEHGEDMPAVRDWRWPGRGRAR